MTPKLIITRPDPEGAAFAQKVQQILGRDIGVIHSPAFEIVPLDVTAPAASHLAFTSLNGVTQAVRLGLSRDIPAFCVGNRTAAAARNAGFTAQSAGGDADALVALIQAAHPAGPILHLAGTHTRGNVARRLTDVGLRCTHLAAYDQVALGPSLDLIRAMAGNEPLVSPVFSARSAAPLVSVGRRAPLHGIAISPTVAAVLTDLGADTVVTVQQPDEASVLRATCDVVLRLFDRG